MTLPIKQLKNLMLTANQFITDSSPENWREFMKAFDEAEKLEQRMGEKASIPLTEQGSFGDYRTADILQRTNGAMQWVFASDTLHVKVMLEMEQRGGAFFFTGQLLSDNPTDERWKGTQVEVSQQSKVVAYAEVDDAGEFEVELASRGDTHFRFIAADGTVLEINNIPIS